MLVGLLDRDQPIGIVGLDRHPLRKIDLFFRLLLFDNRWRSCGCLTFRSGRQFRRRGLGRGQLERDFDTWRAKVIVLRFIHAGNCKGRKTEMSAADKNRGRYPDASAQALLCRVQLDRQVLSQRCWAGEDGTIWSGVARPSNATSATLV